MEEKKIRIIIVEDTILVRLHLVSMIKSMGFDLLAHFSNGEDVVEFLDEQIDNDCDVILMDIVLEGPLDGIETARQINLKHQIPIIYMSALSDLDTLARADQTNSFRYIVKPFEEKEVKSAILDCIKANS